MSGREALKSIDSNSRKSNGDPFLARSKLARSPIRSANNIKKNSGIKKAKTVSAETADNENKAKRSEIMRDITQDLENLSELAAISNNIPNNNSDNKTIRSCTKKNKAIEDENIKQKYKTNNNNNIIERDSAEQNFVEVKVEQKEEKKTTFNDTLAITDKSIDNNDHRVEVLENTVYDECQPNSVAVKNVTNETKAKSSRLNTSLFKLPPFNKKTSKRPSTSGISETCQASIDSTTNIEFVKKNPFLPTRKLAYSPTHNEDADEIDTEIIQNDEIMVNDESQLQYVDTETVAAVSIPIAMAMNRRALLPDDFKRYLRAFRSPRNKLRRSSISKGLYDNSLIADIDTSMQSRRASRVFRASKSIGGVLDMSINSNVVDTSVDVDVDLSVNDSNVKKDAINISQSSVLVENPFMPRNALRHSPSTEHAMSQSQQYSRGLTATLEDSDETDENSSKENEAPEMETESSSSNSNTNVTSGPFGKRNLGGHEVLGELEHLSDSQMQLYASMSSSVPSYSNISASNMGTTATSMMPASVEGLLSKMATDQERLLTSLVVGFNNHLKQTVEDKARDREIMTQQLEYVEFQRIETEMKNAQLEVDRLAAESRLLLDKQLVRLQRAALVEEEVHRKIFGGSSSISITNAYAPSSSSSYSKRSGYDMDDDNNIDYGGEFGGGDDYGFNNMEDAPIEEYDNIVHSSDNCSDEAVVQKQKKRKKKRHQLEDDDDLPLIPRDHTALEEKGMKFVPLKASIEINKVKPTSTGAMNLIFEPLNPPKPGPKKQAKKETKPKAKAEKVSTKKIKGKVGASTAKKTTARVKKSAKEDSSDVEKKDTIKGGKTKVTTTKRKRNRKKDREPAHTKKMKNTKNQVSDEEAFEKFRIASELEVREQMGMEAEDDEVLQMMKDMWDVATDTEKKIYYQKPKRTRNTNNSTKSKDERAVIGETGADAVENNIEVETGTEHVELPRGSMLDHIDDIVATETVETADESNIDTIEPTVTSSEKVAEEKVIALVEFPYNEEKSEDMEKENTESYTDVAVPVVKEIKAPAPVASGSGVPSMAAALSYAMSINKGVIANSTGDRRKLFSNLRKK